MKMKKILIFLAALPLIYVFCSEKEKPTELAVKTHPEGWLKVHGTAIVDSSFTVQSCQECHGTEYMGGNAEVSCYECHTYPHLGTWMQSQSADFHGKIVAADGAAECQPCHGTTFSGGTSGVACSDCHTFPHLSSWMDITSTQFHGVIVQQKGTQECQPCHGQDFKGGNSGVSCFSCHTFPHPDQFLDGTVHGAFIKDSLNWNLVPCQTCHGVEFDGGRVTVGLNCRACHTQAAGPEACNTCHGDFYNPAQIAPPRDLSGNFNTTAVGVGAHQNHVKTTTVTNPYTCAACHPDITTFAQPGHIDNTPGAQMQFSALATHNGTLNVTWDVGTATCSNVYCHGNFEFVSGDSTITGYHDPVSWTNVSSGTIGCDFCHGLPPRGHFGQGVYTSPSSCSQCHSSVVGSNGQIIDKAKHINGKADLN